MTLGRVGDDPIDKHRREAAVVIDRIKRGEEPFPPEPAPEPTVADLAERFLEKFVAVRCKPHTARNYRFAIEHHILPAFGKKTLKEVGPEDVTALHHALRDRPSTANHAVRVPSRMFAVAENWGMSPPGRRPTRHVRRYRKTSRERFLTPEEYRRLGAALKRLEVSGSTMPSAVAAIRLLMLTGCRKSEILTLRWSDVDLDAGVCGNSRSGAGAGGQRRCGARRRPVPSRERAAGACAGGPEGSRVEAKSASATLTRRGTKCLTCGNTAINYSILADYYIKLQDRYKFYSGFIPSRFNPIDFNDYRRGEMRPGRFGGTI